MGERGAVHTFHPTWTEKNADGTKRRCVGKSWCWRFSFRGRSYQGCGDKRTGLPFTTRAKAREAGEERQAEVRAGYSEDPRSTTFATLQEIEKANATLLSPATRKAVAVAWKRLAAFFPKDELAMDLGRRSRLLKYIEHRQAAGSQPNTINFDLNRLKRAMNLAHEEGRLLGVPRFPRLRATRREEYFRPDELALVLSKLPSWWVNFFRVADEMSWRARSELRRLRWSDVDFEGGWVRLEASVDKIRRGRAFPMTQHLRALLQEQRDWVAAVATQTNVRGLAGEPGIPWVFCMPNGKPLGHYQKAWTKACARAGFGKLEGRRGPWSSAKVVHDVRRTTLRRWDLLQGAPLGARMSASGHTSPKTHLDYVGQDPESLKKFGELLDQARGQAPANNVVPLRKAEKS